MMLVCLAAAGTFLAGNLSLASPLLLWLGLGMADRTKSNSKHRNHNGSGHAKPASKAVSPLRRPNNSTTPIRSWLSTVVLRALIASTERLTAVENPMQ